MSIFNEKYLDAPEKFDVIFFTLTLHHCPSIEAVFESIKNALKKDGRTAIVDLCKHPF